MLNIQHFSVGLVFNLLVLAPCQSQNRTVSMLKNLFAATFYFSLIGAGSGLLQNELYAVEPPMVGQTAPQFELKQLQSKEPFLSGVY